MAGSRTLKLSILGDVDNLNKSLKQATGDVETFGDKMTKAGKVAGAALAAAAAAAGAFAIKIGIEAVKSASDLSETVSKVGVLFGDTAKEIEKFAADAAGSLGQTKQQALDAAATFATFGKAAGLSGQDLSKFSIDFVKLSSDLASFNNTSPEQAINAIGAALRGEAEPLRAYGVLLDDASLRQAALELGIVNTTKNALTPQQKVLAAQKLIFEQTGAAQGDFERTSEGLANKTRILTAQFENAKTTIGTALLPIVLEIATVISTTVMPVIESFTASFSDKEGGLGKTISDVGNTIKNTVQPIFEGFKKAIGFIKDAIVESKDEFQSFWEVVKYIAPLIGKTIGAAVSVIGDIVGTVITLVGKILGAVKPVLNFVIDSINTIIKGLNLINPGEDIGLLSRIGETPAAAGFSGTMPNGVAFNTSSAAKTSATPKVQTGEIPTVTPTQTSSPSGVVAASKGAAAAVENWRNYSTKIVGGQRIDSAGNYVGYNAEMAAAMGAGRYQGTTINLNVSGAMDKEGTARTIIDTLNNSFYRGTGGAGNFQIA